MGRHLWALRPEADPFFLKKLRRQHPLLSLLCGCFPAATKERAQTCRKTRLCCCCGWGFLEVVEAVCNGMFGTGALCLFAALVLQWNMRVSYVTSEGKAVGVVVPLLGFCLCGALWASDAILGCCGPSFSPSRSWANFRPKATESKEDVEARAEEDMRGHYCFRHCARGRCCGKFARSRWPREVAKEAYSRQERVPREQWERWEEELDRAPTPGAAAPAPPAPAALELTTRQVQPLRSVIEAEMKNFGGSIESTINRSVGGESSASSDTCPRPSRVVHTLALGDLSGGVADNAVMETRGELRRPLPEGSEREHHRFDRRAEMWILEGDDDAKRWCLDDILHLGDAANRNVKLDGWQDTVPLGDILNPREVVHTITTRRIPT